MYVCVCVYVFVCVSVCVSVRVNIVIRKIINKSATLPPDRRTSNPRNYAKTAGRTQSGPHTSAKLIFFRSRLKPGTSQPPSSV